jgi:hypothetical protein
MESIPGVGPRVIIVRDHGERRPRALAASTNPPVPSSASRCDGKISSASPRTSRTSSSRHTSALATSPAPSAAARAVAVHVKSKPGLRARAIGGANGGSPRCARRATTTLRSEMSVTIARLPPHRHAKTSTQSMRRRSWGHSIREPSCFTTPSPRLVRGRLCTAFSPSLPRSGNVLSPLATNGRSALRWAPSAVPPARWYGARRCGRANGYRCGFNPPSRFATRMRSWSRSSSGGFAARCPGSCTPRSRAGCAAATELRPARSRRS